VNGEPSADTIAAKPAPAAGAMGPLAELIARAAWFPSLVFVVHVFLFVFVRFYDRFPAFDMVTHFTGGVAIAYFFSGTLGILQRRGVIAAPDAAVRALLVFTLTVTAAMFWEFAEYGFDYLFSTRIQVDLADTLSDMALGVFGGLCFLVIGRLARSRRPEVS